MTGRTRRPSRCHRACAVVALALLPAAAFATDEAPRSFATSFVSAAQEVGRFALGLIGVRYRYGGDSPAAGLDCSGLIRYVFQQVTGVTLPRTSRELAQVGARVSVDDLQVGDLVFFNTRNYAFSHVGLYLGENRFIHAPRRGRDVEITTLSRDYWQRHFDGARRLVGVIPSLVPAVIPEAIASTLPIEPPAAEPTTSTAHEETPAP